MKNFRISISECVSRLNKIDISNMEKSDVTVSELSNILNTYKGMTSIIESDLSTLSNLDNISVKSDNMIKVKEAVYLGTSYLMRANSTMGKLIEVSHENVQSILTQFINYEDAELNVQFESAITDLVNQNSDEDDDYDDFI